MSNGIEIIGGTLDNTISHTERQIYRYKNILIQLRNTKAGIINGRKADAEAIDSEITETDNRLKQNRRKMCQLLNQYFNTEL